MSGYFLSNTTFIHIESYYCVIISLILIQKCYYSIINFYRAMMFLLMYSPMNHPQINPKIQVTFLIIISTSRQLNHLNVGSPTKPFSQTNQAYAIAEPSEFSKSPFLAHKILLLATYTAFGGCLSKSFLLDIPSKKDSLRSIATLCPFVIEEIAFSTNSIAYLYGGFVIISPSNVSEKERKSTPPFQIHDLSNR